MGAGNSGAFFRPKDLGELNIFIKENGPACAGRCSAYGLQRGRTVVQLSLKLYSIPKLLCDECQPRIRLYSLIGRSSSIGGVFGARAISHSGCNSFFRVAAS